MFKKFLLAKRINKIKKRKLPSTKNESHAREFFARKVFLPEMKKAAGNELLAVLLIGSSQLGVRSAHPKSDIDIEVVISKKGLVRLIDSGFFVSERTHMPKVEQLKLDAERMLGCRIDLTFLEDLTFKENLQKPFQIIYGNDYVNQSVPDKHLASMAALRTQMKTDNAKYVGRK